MKLIKVLKKVYWKVYEFFLRIISSLSPKIATKMLFRFRMKKKLNLAKPESLNEKVSWLKLNTYYNNELVTQCADKFCVRNYLNDLDLGNLLIPLLGVYDNFDDIKWDELPNKFVLKCNHGCGYNLICIDKSKIDYKATKKMVDKWMREDYWRRRAEVNYRFIKKKIIIEEYIEAENGLTDYKFYCFNGQVIYTLVCMNRRFTENGAHATYAFMDREWNVMPFSTDAIKANCKMEVERPVLLEKAIEYAEKLSKPFPFVRTDLYILKDKILFGELTFTPAGGMDTDLYTGDDIMGKLIELDKK